MVGDGTWLALGEVVDLYRKAGYPESESTIRLEIDDAIAKGTVATYRTRGGHRRVRASDVRALLEAKGRPPGDGEQ